jgi:hypothetical protein
VTVKVPAFTTNSPQNDHKNTTPKHRNSRKTPAKMALDHRKKSAIQGRIAI